MRDGSTLRLLLLPSYHHITVQLSGIKCPGFKREADGSETPEPFVDEAKQYVESRLLQRDVQVILEGVANQSNGILLGTILHPVGFPRSLIHIFICAFRKMFEFFFLYVEWQHFRVLAQRGSSQVRRLVDGSGHQWTGEVSNC